MSTVGGYHEYTGGCSIHRGVIVSTVGDTMSTLGDVQYNFDVSVAFRPQTSSLSEPSLTFAGLV